MKKVLFMMAVAVAVASCKKDDKVVGKDKDGKELVVNEKGDTVAKTQTVDSLKTETTAPKVMAVAKGTDGKYSYKYNLEIGKTYPMINCLLETERPHSRWDISQSVIGCTRFDRQELL